MKINFSQFKELVYNISHRRVDYGRFKVIITLFVHGKGFMDFTMTTTNEDYLNYDLTFYPESEREKTMRAVFDIYSDYNDQMEI